MKLHKLRFAEFKEEHLETVLGELVRSISSGKSKVRQVDGSYPLYGSTGLIGFLEKPDYSGLKILIARVGANAGNLYKVNGEYCVTDNTLILDLPEGIDAEFLYQYLTALGLNKLVFGSGQPLITGGQLKSQKMLIPLIAEQQKIAAFLTAVDDKMEQLSKKKALLEQYKKGLMQQIFIQEIRFKDENGDDYPEWEEKELGELMNFKQPTNYIVADTKYSDTYETPVLTAGKTFILGYTAEVTGIFKENLPVIIFDDFTTATQFVDFPFKVKSSAMKILMPKSGVNAKFVYEAMQNIKYEIGGHGRHWISIFARIKVFVPSIEEQTKIANFLSSLDDKIKYVDQQVELTKQYKKGLLQQMFV